MLIFTMTCPEKLTPPSVKCLQAYRLVSDPMGFQRSLLFVPISGVRLARAFVSLLSLRSLIFEIRTWKETRARQSDDDAEWLRARAHLLLQLRFSLARCLYRYCCLSILYCRFIIPYDDHAIKLSLRHILHHCLLSGRVCLCVSLLLARVGRGAVRSMFWEVHPPDVPTVAFGRLP